MLSTIGRKGPTSMSVKEVSLVIVSGPEAVTKGNLTDMGNGNILVTVNEVPEGEFVVVMRGTDQVSETEFQRHVEPGNHINIPFSVMTQGTGGLYSINIRNDRNFPMTYPTISVEPGNHINIPFSVMTQGTGGSYSINIRNDRNFPMTYPGTITLTTGQYSNATVMITPPSSTESGTDAEDCPEDLSRCGSHRWGLSTNITDGNGTQIQSVSLDRGNGTLDLSPVPAPLVQAAYNASCCSQEVEIIAVDAVGNVGRCFHSIARSGGPPALSLAPPLWLCLLAAIFVRP
ncbi:unnamed protein product [Menidia menidia]|uniref:(Atlantic silverside) hypothetical protein n=1 Tax=Menidia menidia TaxID=238744 RepID=A0A8S4BQA0_9TELE|nr:unnamed protein product [Menidia menidia]